MQILAKLPENQSPAPSQTQELTQEGANPQKELPPGSRVSAEPPPQPSSLVTGVAQLAQDLAPNQKEEDAPQAGPASETVTISLPESEAQTSEVKAGEGGPPSPAPSQGASGHPDPEPGQGPQLDQDEESGEAKVTPTRPPLPELPQGSGPTSHSPQGTQDEEPGSTSEPPRSPRPPGDPSHPDEAKMLGSPPEDSQQPLEEGLPKAEVVRADTPYPELPHPPDTTDTSQTQDRGDPVTVLPKGRLAPTRLPQPRVLAPLQSPRPIPKLLSPSRGEAPGPASEQPPLAQEGDPSKLPPISPPHSKQPRNLSPHLGPSPQQVQGEKVREVKLPLISPPVQEQAPQAAPDPPQEEAAQGVKLPRIPTPFSEQQLPHNTGAARHDLKPAKERQAPKAVHSSSKKIPDIQAPPPNQELVPQRGARKKKLPLHRETAKGPAQLQRAPPGGHKEALQSESQSNAGRPQPNPPSSPQRNQPGQDHTPDILEAARIEPLPKDAQIQEEKGEKVHYSGKKAHAKHPPNDLVQKATVSKKGLSPKRENSGGLSQENKTTLSSDQPPPEGQPLPRRPLQSEEASTESTPEASAPREHPGRRNEVHKRGRSQKAETTSGPPEQDGMAPRQQPVQATQAHQGASRTTGSSVQRDSTSRQQAKERRTWKHQGAPTDNSLATPQRQVAAEEQGTQKGRLRARGSQSIKV